MGNLFQSRIAAKNIKTKLPNATKPLRATITCQRQVLKTKATTMMVT